MSWSALFQRFFFPQPVTFPVAAGLYAYQYEGNGERSHLHLRVDAQGNGVLLVNASRIYHFNPTATLMAWAILEGKSEEEQVALLVSTYAVRPAQAREDLKAFREQLAGLIRPDGACPFHELELETMMPFRDRPAAPYRMDLALTYRCNNECAHCYNARARNYPELPTEDWKRILEILRDVGIPHVVFTGGEVTLREDLPELIAHATQLGLITGLNTNGRRLAEARYVQRLVEAGLDHVQITVESCDAEIHNRMVGARAFEQTIRGLKNALASPLFVMTNTTLLRDNAHTIAQTIDFLAEIGVPTIGINALIYSGHGLKVGTGLAEAELYPLLEIARQKTQEHGQRLIWYPLPSTVILTRCNSIWGSRDVPRRSIACAWNPRETCSPVSPITIPWATSCAIPGKPSGITRFVCVCVSAAMCRRPANPARFCRSAAVDVR
uniref:Hypothetical conserved protein n=1 Tax=uncultured Chloroflexota bacterium TaxID=166587 RepID=H5SCX1_9CHLR|nr:hypothetical conserved protein [uncultured Chloroflexota bacterium]